MPLELDGTRAREARGRGPRRPRPARRGRAGRALPRRAVRRRAPAGRHRPRRRRRASAAAGRRADRRARLGEQRGRHAPAARGLPRAARPAWWSPTRRTWRRGPTGSCSCATGASSTRPARRPAPNRCSAGPVCRRMSGRHGRRAAPPCSGGRCGMFRRELAPAAARAPLLTVAVGAAVAGSAMRRRTPRPDSAGAGTATPALIRLDGTDPGSAAGRHRRRPRARSATVDVDRPRHVAVPGSVRAPRRARPGPERALTASRCWRLREGRYPTARRRGGPHPRRRRPPRRRRRRRPSTSAVGRRRSSASSRTPATSATTSRSSRPGSGRGAESYTVLVDPGPAAGHRVPPATPRRPARDRTAGSSNRRRSPPSVLAASTLAMALVGLWWRRPASWWWRSGASASSGCSPPSAPPTATCGMVMLADGAIVGVVAAVGRHRARHRRLDAGGARRRVGRRPSHRPARLCPGGWS